MVYAPTWPEQSPFYVEEVKEEFLHRRLVAKLRTFLHFFLVFLDLFYSSWIVLGIKTEKEQFSGKCYQAVGDTTTGWWHYWEPNCWKRRRRRRSSQRIFSSYEYVHPLSSGFLNSFTLWQKPKEVPFGNIHIQVLLSVKMTFFWNHKSDNWKKCDGSFERNSHRPFCSVKKRRIKPCTAAGTKLL